MVAKRDRKAHGWYSFRTRPAAARSVHKHSQTCTTASTRVSLVVELLEAWWCEKLIWY